MKKLTYYGNDRRIPPRHLRPKHTSLYELHGDKFWEMRDYLHSALQTSTMKDDAFANYVWNFPHFVLRGNAFVQYCFTHSRSGTIRKGVELMAKNNNRENITKWNGFININLSASDADELADWVRDNQQNMDKLFQNFLESGHKMKISWDDSSQCFLVVMTCNNPDSPNAGYGMSSRSRDWLEAIQMCMYKHYAVCDTDWTSYAGKKTGFAWG